MESEVNLKQQRIDQIRTKKIPEKEELFATHFIPPTKTIPVVYKIAQQTRAITQPTVTKTKKVFAITNQKKGIKAKGRYYDANKFIVLSGSTVSNSLDKSFGKSAAIGAYELRKNLEQTGIINVSREFIEDYTFNSIGQAACVVIGGSRNGITAWK